MKIVAVTQARTGSTRLPGKILKKIEDVSLLERHLSRIKKAKKIDELIVATTTQKEDDVVAVIAAKLGIPCSRGSVEDVLDRFYHALLGKDADYVVRLTSDCPLIDPELIDKVIQYCLDLDLDYCSNTLDPKYPDGQDVEVFRYSVFVKAWQEAKLASEREHVTPYIWKHSTFKGATMFKSSNYDEGFSYGHLRMTVDEQSDFDLITDLVKHKGANSTWLEYAQYLENNQLARALNEGIIRNEGYQKSTQNESK